MSAIQKILDGVCACTGAPEVEAAKAELESLRRDRALLNEIRNAIDIGSTRKTLRNILRETK